MVRPNIEGAPQWWEPLLSIFGVKVSLDPFDGNCKFFVENFVEYSNPKVSICRTKGMGFALVEQIDVDQTITYNDNCGFVLEIFEQDKDSKKLSTRNGLDVPFEWERGSLF